MLNPDDLQALWLTVRLAATVTAILLLIGGVIGIAIGVVGALIVGKLGDLPVELNAKVVMLAAAFSIGTGLFFGYYPARKASQLDPIEALRSQ